VQSEAQIMTRDQDGVRLWCISRCADQQRGNQLLVAISRCIQLFVVGDEAIPHGRATRDTICSNGNILQPFGHAQYWFFHRSFAWKETNSQVPILAITWRTRGLRELLQTY
jgi:hypothetical protein